MRRLIHPLPCLAVVVLAHAAALAQAPVVTQTNVPIRVMAANTTTGNFQRYETPGLNIFRGLKPDVVAVQEFNYASATTNGLNMPAAFREMIDGAFGTNFVYFRETGYSIPNGIISRWPIRDAGSWDDVQVPDRGFAWACIDIPGTNDLYVVSVHLHGNGGPSSRAIEAANLKTLIQSNTNFPANAFLVVGGDLNTDSRTEACLNTFKTFLSDSPIPHDGTPSANSNTSQPRSKPYDYVLPSFTLATNQVPTVIGPRSFPNGLVFDSRVYTNLADVSPVQQSDSAAVNMQHMAVVKDFRVSYTVTNFIPVSRPLLTMASTNAIQWRGLSNLTYTVQASTSLTNWTSIGTASSSTTNFTFAIPAGVTNRRFFRVTYP